MTYRRATWLAKVLRNAGLSVVEEPGWKKRGLSRRLPFDPQNVVWHHDASEKGPSPGVVAYMLRRFATAAAQLWVCMGCNGQHPIGTWHILAAGRAPHAGAVRRGMPDNYDSLGVETDHTTGERWHPDLLRSLRVGTAAILDHLKRPAAEALHFHKTICFPKGRKTDPDGLHLASERTRVDLLMKPARKKVYLKKLRKAARQHSALAPVSTHRVQRELRKEGLLKGYVPGHYGGATRRAYADWQRSLGYSGVDADGIPGAASLRALARRRHAFRVKG